jgi:chromatin assembly factor 1 subunit B
LDKSLGSKEVAKGNLTPETKKPVSADSMKVDISASTLKMEASPVAVGVRAPLLPTENITSKSNITNELLHLQLSR